MKTLLKGKPAAGRLLGVALALVACAGARPLGAQTTLGELQRIVVDGKAAEHERHAAGVLSRTLKRMGGPALAVTNVPAKGASRMIVVGRAAVDAGLIGEAELAAVLPDGFVLKAKDGVIALAGPRPRGSIYGAYALLERLGYRWFTHGVERLPPALPAVLENTTLSEKPSYAFRSGSPWELRASLGDIADPRKALNPELFATDSNLWIDHTPGYLVPKKLYYDAHPEYYAMKVNGERIPKKTSDAYIHLCLSNPDVVRISIERTLGWMRLQPEPRYFCITQGDGTQWCQCDACKALDVQTGNYADRLLTWVNAIARAAQKEFPEKIILTAGYCGSDTAPLRERPEKNVRVMYAPYWGVALSELHPLTHPANAEALKQLEAWLAVAPDQIYIYDYNMYYVPTWDVMAEKLKWYHAKGIEGIWFCGAPTCFRELFQYVTRRLCWDVTLDPEALKREYVEAVYGPAAPHMLAYFARVKARLAKGFPRGIHDWFTPVAFYDDGHLTESLKLFDRMVEAVRDDARLSGLLRQEREMMVADFMAGASFGRTGVPENLRRQAVALLTGAVAEQLRAFEEIDAQRQGSELTAVARAALDKRHADAVKALTGRFRASGIRPPEGDPVAFARAFLKAPEETARAHLPPPEYPQTAAEKTAKGVRLPATAFSGGHGPIRDSWMLDEARVGMALYAPASPRPSVMRATFPCDRPPAGACTMRLEGNGGDKDLLPATGIAVTINDREIYRGPCGFGRRAWSWSTLPIPAGALKAGENTLVIANVMPGQRLDHFWCEIAEVQIDF